MHERIVEAQKRLVVAKDHYMAAIKAIEGQYVKPLVGAGVEAEAVAKLRADYSIAIEPPSENEDVLPTQVFLDANKVLDAAVPNLLKAVPKLPKVKKARATKGKK